MTSSPQQISNLIDGKCVEASSDEVLEVHNPATAEVLAQFATSTAEDVDGAVRSARTAFVEWSRTTPAERSARMHQFANLVGEHLDELVELEVRDAGKPWTATHTGEFVGLLDTLRHFAGACRMTSGQAAGEYMEGNTSVLRREPVGVVAGITPWNFPLMQAVQKIAPAVATGNTIVVKPAENTPLSTTRFAELAAEVFPPGVLNIVHGRGTRTGEALVAHPGVDLVSFTGSVNAGRAIARTASDGLKRSVMELGGNAPVLVFDDADVDQAVEKLTFAGLFNAGQECMSATRLLIAEPIRDRFVEALAHRVKQTVVGDTLDPTSELGPLISAAQRDRVESYITRRSTGSEVVLGGDRPDLPGYYVNPTIISGVEQDEEIVQEEIFGPVFTVQTFIDEADALTKANGVRYGLAGSIWTRDVARALRLSNALDFGTVWVNNHMVVTPEIPVGGFGDSGYGKEGGIAGIEEFTRLKHVVISLD